jgi:hypothetical protein
MLASVRRMPARWNTPVDAASLAVFRILFGLLLAVAMVRFIALGWIDELYLAPRFHFTWAAFSWVRPLPPALMHAHFQVLVILALAIAAGFHSRVCAALFFAGFTYVELLDKATYLNHYYLISLLSGLLVVMPAHRTWSIDAWRRPRSAAATVPTWAIDLLRFQVGVVYVFAGLAKLNADWLLHGQPLRIWLAARSDLPLVGGFLAQRQTAYVSSWCGAGYDLCIVIPLMNRRWRSGAYGTVVVFHALTGLLFPIGMFPAIMIVATLIFFPSDWPRRWLRAGRLPDQASPLDPLPTRPLRTAGCVMLVAYAAMQVAVPLRSYWPAMEPDWTNRGFNFAWRVMLVEKAGYVDFAVSEPSTGRRWRVRTADYLTERQARMMAQDPEMIRALARRIAADWRARGIARVEVRADAFATLNGRPPQRLIDPHVDLAAPTLSSWIVPLRHDPATWSEMGLLHAESPARDR